MNSKDNKNNGFDGLQKGINKSKSDSSGVKSAQAGASKSSAAQKSSGAVSAVKKGSSVSSAKMSVKPSVSGRGTGITAASKPVSGGTKTFSAPAKPVDGSASGTNGVRVYNSQKDKSPASVQNKNTASDAAVKSKKKKKKSSGLLGGIARFLVYIIFVVAVSVFLATVIIRVANDVFAFVKDSEPVTVEIPENADTSDVSKILAENGIIEYPGIFRMYTDMKKSGSTYYTDGYKNGSFEVNPSMNYDDLIYTFSKNSATREIVRLTFPEGSTTDEIIEILIKGGVQNTKEEYIDVIQNYDFDYRFIKELDTASFKNGRKYRLEGYLFPDTYDFYTDASAAAVIDKFLVNFNNKFDTTFYDAAYKHDMTVDEIITIASLVEKEARRADDLGGISSVFHNRLKNSNVYPYLQSDATVQYAFPERKSTITPEDLKYDTPYNTYLYTGLPPSAIANPGLDAITNALYPEETSYYFFIANSRGETLFAKTLDGHNANIAMIQKEAASAQ